MSPADETKRIASNDLQANFVESMAIYAAWEYSVLHDRLASDPLLDDERRHEMFSTGRAIAISKAMIRAAEKHGVPYEVKRLDCNGQAKLFVKAGRVVMIQETMTSLYCDKPKIAAYKTEISRCSGVITQLELDLGDRPSELLDWSDSVLAVLLHGASGPRFSERDCKLGALMLAFPDTSYLNWTLRLDLHDLAMFGNSKNEEVRSSYGDHQQEDRVVVKRRQHKKALRSNG